MTPRQLPRFNSVSLTSSENSELSLWLRKVVGEDGQDDAEPQ